VQWAEGRRKARAANVTNHVSNELANDICKGHRPETAKSKPNDEDKSIATCSISILLVVIQYRSELGGHNNNIR